LSLDSLERGGDFGPGPVEAGQVKRLLITEVEVLLGPLTAIVPSAQTAIGE